MSEQKLCINCRFCDEEFVSPRCDHPDAVVAVSPVDGRKFRRTCEEMRERDGLCGDGALFEPFEPKPPRPWYLRWLP